MGFALMELEIGNRVRDGITVMVIMSMDDDDDVEGTE